MKERKELFLMFFTIVSLGISTFLVSFYADDYYWTGLVLGFLWGVILFEPLLSIQKRIKK